MAFATKQTEWQGNGRPDLMRAAVFRGREQIVIEEHPLPRCGPRRSK